MEEFNFILTTVIASIFFSFAIAFPIIHMLYAFKITRRLENDFSTLIESVKSKAGTPIMGGLIVIITVLVLNLLFNPERNNEGTLLLLGIFVLSALLGGIDDLLNIYGKPRAPIRPVSRTITLIKVHKSKLKRLQLFVSLPWEIYKKFFFMLGSNPGKGIQAHEKIIIQSIAGLALGVGIYQYTSRENPGLVPIPLTDVSIDIGILMIPFAWIAVILMTNAVNLADGMDGLAASELITSFLGFLVIAIVKEDIRTSFLIATVVGALISYLYFNVPPARFQMGDVGSLSLGALLASVGFILGEPLMLLIIPFPFVVTLLSAVFQGIGRRLLGRRILRMAPIHYHLQIKNNWSEEKVVMRLALLGLFTSLLGIWIFLVI